MSSLRRLLGIALFVAFVSGCWPTPGAGPDRRSFNPFERTLTPATVGRLTEAFRADLPDGAGPPVVTVDGLFVRTGLSIAAFEPGTGAPRWSVRLPEFDDRDFFFTVSEPHVVDGRHQVLATSSYRFAGLHVTLVALASRTGAAERRPVSGVLTSFRGTDLAVVRRDVADTSDITSLFVIGPDGEQRWGGWAGWARDGAGSLGQGQFFLTTGTSVQAYDTTTPCPVPPGGWLRQCDPQWIHRVGATPSPVVIGDEATVYVGGGTAVVALDAGSGAVRWSSDVGAVVTTAPALADGVLYAGADDGRLVALPAGGCGATSCVPMWTTPAAGPTSVQPAVAGDVVYVGSTDGTLRAFDADGCEAATCQPLWTTDVGAPVTGGLAVYGGQLYVGTQTGLVAYGLPA